MRALAVAAGDEDEYRRGYDLCSQRHHWDPADTARALIMEGGAIRYVVGSPLAQASALVLVFAYLIRMADLVNTALERGMAAPLSAIKQRYMDTATMAGYEIDVRPV